MLGFKYLGQLRRLGRALWLYCTLQGDPQVEEPNVLLFFSKRPLSCYQLLVVLCYGARSILPPGVISTSLSGLWLRFKVITCQDHLNASGNLTLSTRYQGVFLDLRCYIVACLPPTTHPNHSWSYKPPKHEHLGIVEVCPRAPRMAQHGISNDNVQKDLCDAI